MHVISATDLTIKIMEKNLGSSCGTQSVGFIGLNIVTIKIVETQLSLWQLVDPHDLHIRNIKVMDQWVSNNENSGAMSKSGCWIFI